MSSICHLTLPNNAYSPVTQLTHSLTHPPTHSPPLQLEKLSRPGDAIYLIHAEQFSDNAEGDQVGGHILFEQEQAGAVQLVAHVRGGRLCGVQQGQVRVGDS